MYRPGTAPDDSSPDATLASAIEGSELAPPIDAAEPGDAPGTPEAEVEEAPESPLAAAVRGCLRAYPDFPEPGVVFQDINPAFRDPELIADVVDRLADEAHSAGAEKIAGIESRGFLLGVSVAQALEVPFFPIRKKGKLPGETVAQSYELEYGDGHLELQEEAVGRDENVFVIDDLLATGGTLAAAVRLVERAGGHVAGLGVLVELPELDGRASLEGYNLFTILSL